MNIFQHTDYKKFFNEWVAEQPKAGRGEYRRVAQRLNVSSTMISQIFRGDKHLSPELAAELSEYLGLGDNETDYFFLLIDFSKAGSYKLQQRLKKRIARAQGEAQKLESRLKKDMELDEVTKSIFYSSWLYSGVQMLIAVPEFNDAQMISERLHLPREQVQKILQFLLQEGLVIREGQKLDVGPKRTHIGADSPLVSKHHQNWRINGFQAMQQTREADLFYTGPMSLSHEVAEKIRRELPAVIERINKWVIPSPSETVCCLNIDWFSY